MVWWAPGNDDELKVLVGLDERIDHLHCRRRIDIVVEFAHDKHKRTAKQMRILDIGALLVLVAHGVTEPKLIPPYLVHAVVMAAEAE